MFLLFLFLLLILLLIFIIIAYDRPHLNLFLLDSRLWKNGPSSSKVYTKLFVARLLDELSRHQLHGLMKTKCVDQSVMPVVVNPFVVRRMA